MKRRWGWLCMGFWLIGLSSVSWGMDMVPVSHSADSLSLGPLQSLTSSSVPVTPVSLTTPAEVMPSTACEQRDLPEPATIALIGLGAVAVCSCRRRFSH